MTLASTFGHSVDIDVDVGIASIFDIDNGIDIDDNVDIGNDF